MDSIRMVFVLAVLVVSISTARGASSVLGEDEWWNHQLNASYHRSLLVSHPNPESEVSLFNSHVHKAFEGSNSTRRGLHKKLAAGECIAENPIDQCWRCKDDWEANRKHLADCVLGFGRNTTGGKDGDFYVVTDHDDHDVVNPKPGTLRHAVLEPRPLWIIFAHNMHIKLKAELMVTSDKTIDGRGSRVEIAHGCGITVMFQHNVIIHNIKIHDIVPGHGGLIRDSGTHVGIRGQDDGDGISIFGSCNVWVDHVSVKRCKDGLVDAVQASTGITISNSHFTNHNDVMLFGASDVTPTDKVMQITVAFNNFGKKLIQRMPRCRFGFFHVVNNDYTYWELYAIGGTSAPTIISQGNRFTAPDNPRFKELTQRNNGVGDEYKNWIWRSEGDLMLNGAFFVESGHPMAWPADKNNYIEPKPGTFVGKLTRCSGHLKCVVGKRC